MNINFSNRDIDSIKGQYHDFILKYKQDKDRLDKRSLLISIIRFIAFLLAMVVIYIAIKDEKLIYWIIATALLIAFIILMKFHSRLFKQRKYLSNLLLINEQELLSLQGDNSSFYDGEGYQIDYHDFSLDLDIFGKQSIYQKINRTTTAYGEKLLAKWFNEPLLNIKEIEERQNAASELSEKIGYRQSFAAKGMSVKEKNEDFEFLNNWHNQKNMFYGKTIYKLLILLFPIINITAIFLYSFDYLEGKYIGLSLLITLIFAGLYQKKIHKIQRRNI